MDLRWISLVLLLLCCTAPPVEPKRAKVKKQYQRFLLEHVNLDMNIDQCTSVMRQRDIVLRDGNTINCKPVNSFILADQNHVKAVCNGDGSNQIQNWVISYSKFRVNTCRLLPGQRYPNCLYGRGEQHVTVIALRCPYEDSVHRLPVYYLER